MSVYGYCRISTPQQNIERQVRNIAATYPAAHIVREVYTGTACQGRRELDKLLHTVQPGDTIVFDSVSRMSRNAEEGCDLYETLYNRGVTLCFLKEPHINTDTYKQALQRQVSTTPETGSAATDRFVSGIMDALNLYTADLAKEQIRLAFAQAQKEVDDLHQRTREGLMTARLNGKQIGQTPGRKLNIKKSAPCKEQIKKYSRDFDGTLTDAECIKLIGIARNTYYKYKREIREKAAKHKPHSVETF
ncbi:MAG: recombinase family protein [Subdoligranulum sp.]|nr:recombinase family protein [Subdoligranulum sp.]